jgi:hypothetical protein
VLKVTWPVGNRYVYRMELEQHSTNRMSDFPRTRDEDINLGVTYSVSVLNEHELDVQFLAYDLTMKIGGLVAITFDSAAPTPTGAIDPITAPFRKVAGSNLRLQIDPEGRTDRVVGLAEWVARVAGDAKGPAGDLLIQQFNEGFFRQIADFGRGLPTVPVQAGSSWPYRTELPAGGLGKIALDSTVTLTRWESHDQHRYAVLESKGSLKGVPGSTTNAVPGALSIASGTVAGQSWFDPDPGVLTESVVEQSMRLTGEVSAPQGEAQKFTSDIGQKVTLKMVESTHRP